MKPFSPDSATVAVPLAKGGARLIELKTFAPIATLTASGCETPVQIAWSPKADTIATGSDSSHVCVFDASTHRLIRSWAVPLRQHSDSHPEPAILLLAFVAGGRGIVAGNFDGQGYALSVWDVATGKELEPRGNYGTLAGMRVTTRGDAITENAHIDMGLRFEVSPLPDWAGVADISAEGRYVVNGSFDAASKGLHTIGVPLPTFEHADGAVMLRMSPDGSKVLGVVNAEPRVWDLESGAQLYP